MRCGSSSFFDFSAHYKEKTTRISDGKGRERTAGESERREKEGERRGEGRRREGVGKGKEGRGGRDFLPAK